MNVLFIGDIHIKFKNIKQVDILQSKLHELTNIDLIVFAGDILDSHEKIETQLMNRAYELIDELRSIAPVYILVGNHDYINNQQFLTTNHWMNGMKKWDNVYIVDTPIETQHFVFVPYVPPGRFCEALNFILDWKSKKCIFAHQEFKGCKMGAITSRDGDEWDLAWPMVISGHIHEKQLPQKNIYYPGSVLNHAFGYDSQGLSLFNFDSDDVSEVKIDLGFVKKKIIYMPIGKKIKDDDLVEHNKFSISGTPSNIAEFKHTPQYQAMISKNIKVVFRLEKITVPQTIYFPTILSQLIENENNIELNQDFEIIS